MLCRQLDATVCIWPPLVTERSNVSCSLSSINMRGSTSGCSESDDDDLMEDGPRKVCYDDAGRMYESDAMRGA